MKTNLSTSSPLTQTPTLLNNAPVLVSAMLLLSSMHLIFAALLRPYLPPSLSALYVLSIATIETGIFVSFRGGIRLSLFKENVWFFLAIGLLVAVSTNLNYAAVYFIDPGMASLLNQSTVLFGLALGLLWLGDRLNHFHGIGAVIAILGVIVISFQPGDLFRLGSLLILGSAFTYALHAALTKRFAQDMDLGNFFFFRLLLTSIFMLGIGLSQTTFILPVWQGALLLFVVGTFDVVISRTLYYAALRHLNLSIHALVLTLSPVLTVFWSFLIFGSQPTLQQGFGGMGVIGGIMLVTWGQIRKARGI